MECEEKNELLYLMDQTYASLIAVSNKLQAAGDTYCGDLTSKQMITLLAILHLADGDASIMNIAEKLGTTKQNATRILKSLEKKKYIAISTSEKDKRAVNVRLTEAGIHCLSRDHLDIKRQFMNDIFKDFQKEELNTLWTLLKKLYAYNGVPMNGFEKRIVIPDLPSDTAEK